jgi:hypothetical protein
LLLKDSNFVFNINTNTNSDTDINIYTYNNKNKTNNNINSNLRFFLNMFDINPFDIIEMFSFKNNEEIILYENINFKNINNPNVIQDKEKEDINNNIKIKKLSNKFFHCLISDIKYFSKNDNLFSLGNKEYINFKKIDIINK